MKGLLLRGTGLFVLLFLLFFVDLSSLAQILAESDFRLVFAGALAAIPAWLLRAVKWHRILKGLGIDSSPRPILIGTIAGDHLGTISPAKVGEVVKIGYLKRDAPVGVLITSLLADRVADVAVLLLFGCTGLLIWSLEFGWNIETRTIIIVTVCLLAFVLLFAFLKSSYVKDWLSRAEKSPERSGFAARTSDSVKKILLDTLQIPAKTYVAVIFLSALVLGTTFARAYFFALSLGLDVSPVFLLALIPVAGLIQSLPITIMGIGTRDALFVVAFSFIGLGSALAIGYSALFLFARCFELILSYALWCWRPPLAGDAEANASPS